MTRVALVSCVKKKRGSAAPAGDLYLSQLFRGLRHYAEAHADVWYILSAEHGVLHPEQVIEPYERTLNAMPKRDRLAWAERVEQQLLELLPADAEVILLAGSRYREEIEPFLRRQGFHVTIPLEGLGIGKQLQQLKRAVNMTHITQDDLDRFYVLLARLAEAPGQGRPLRELPKRATLPNRGVYFFHEPGEYRAATSEVPRVVRVGTHAVSAGSKSTLHGRLKQHLGTRTGGGHHRGSIFRRHVGDALLAREGISLPTWGVGDSAPSSIRAAEATHERRVSDHIAAMPVLWVHVPDEPGPNSARTFIEKNAIALLSNQCSPSDNASESWLGRDSGREKIRNSGLWNLNHVDEVHDPKFLDTLESFVILTREREPLTST